MKNLLVIVSLMVAVNASAFIDPKIGGTITLAKGLEKNLTPNGILYVFARRAMPGSKLEDHTPPIAAIKIDHPKFPQAFSITGKNVMMEGASLVGAVHVIARYSLTGDALDKKGAIEGFDPKNKSTEVGNNNLNIVLKTILK